MAFVSSWSYIRIAVDSTHGDVQFPASLQTISFHMAWAVSARQADTMHWRAAYNSSRVSLQDLDHHTTTGPLFSLHLIVDSLSKSLSYFFISITPVRHNHSHAALSYAPPEDLGKATFSR